LLSLSFLFSFFLHTKKMQMQMASGEQGGVGASGGGCCCCSCFLSLVVLRGETARKNLPKKMVVD
jgi:hypothetical protein